MSANASTLLAVACCALLLGCAPQRIATTTPTSFESVVEGPASMQASDVVNARSFVTSSTGWAVGTTEQGGALVARTTNGGASWTVILRDPEGFTLRAVDFVDAEHGWAVGGPVSAGMILATSDGGSTWRGQGDGDYRALGYVEFADVLNGEVRGGTSDDPSVPLVLRTSDGGRTWTRR